MDVAAASNILAEGRIPDQWPIVAAMERTALSKDDLALLKHSLEAFVVRLYERLESLSRRLVAAGFRFMYSNDYLRRATPEDAAALEAFIEQYGPVPLSVEAWYRRIASFGFIQHGEQMFDRTLPFYYMVRGLTFTMPPIQKACSGRWHDEEGCDESEPPVGWLRELLGYTPSNGHNWPADDSSAPDVSGSDDLRIPVDEFWMDDDWKGFDLPNPSVDPVIDPATGTRFLQWAEFQTRWGGYGRLATQIETGVHDEFSDGMDLERLRDVLQPDESSAPGAT